MISSGISTLVAGIARIATLAVLLMFVGGANAAGPSAGPNEKAAHYKVTARFDRGGQLQAAVEIVMPLAEIGAQTSFLLGERFKVAKVDAGRTAQIDIAPTDQPFAGLQKITVRFDEAPTAPVTVRMRYAGPVNLAEDDPAFSKERVELQLENFWLPTRSDLNLQYTVDARVRGLPAGIVAVTQGEFHQRGSELIVHRTLLDNDLTIAGALSLSKQTALDVEFYAADHSDPLTALMYKHAVGAAAFQRSIYGAPEGGGPIRMVVVPRASSGGYARRNFIVMPNFRKPGDPPPPFDQSSPARFVSHEFNHAWSKLPSAGGENYWVAESVAEYMALRYVEATFGADELKTMLERKRKAPDAGPLVSNSGRPSGAALYQKGPVLLFDLEQRIGRAKLDHIVGRPDRPLDTSEFLAALTRETDEAQARQFERSLNRGGTVYTVIMSGASKGEMTIADDGNGQRRVLTRFEDRGRGPDLLTRSRVDERGWLQSFSVEGLSYAKRPVAERFEVRGGRATWSSAADDGDAAANGYYVANQSSAEDFATLARALLSSEKQTVPLLPSGQARIEKVTLHELKAEAGSVTATLYLIHGTDLQPAPIWLDDKKELFASGSSWLAVIKKGYEASIAELLEVQEKALITAAATKTASLRRQPAGAVLIRNARVFDAQRRIAQPGMSVLIRGDRIEAVGADGSVKAPAAAEIIDAQGKTLLPGLWDMHVHLLSHDEGLFDLLAGVTSVRDLGNDPDVLARLTQQFDDATLAGPWVMKAGMIDGGGPFAGPTRYVVNTADEMRKAVNDLADRGYPQVKLYSSLTRELVNVGVAAARARGMRVSGHVPAGMTMREAVMAGYDEVQHANFWFLNFMDADTVAKTNTPVRFTATAARARDVDLASPEVRDFIALLKKKGTVVDPTLVVFEDMFTGWKGEMSAWTAPWVDRLPASATRGARAGGRASTPEERAKFTESFTRMKQMLKAMYDAGIPIVAGTDGSALQYSRELELYVEAGIPAADVLYIATLGSARIMKKDAQTGSITRGKRADLVLIDGDPLARMSDIRRARWVMKGGAIYDAAALAAAAGLTGVP
jgi:imidazolonepropionase-like amidohydrolase